MSIFEIILISIGLAMDAFAVSISLGGCHVKTLSSRHILAFKAAVLFGLFQAGMPIIGWICGRQFQDYIQAIDHWIAFTLLVVIGLKMLHEAWQNHPEETKQRNSLKALLILAVATSIDALAVGVTFSVLQINLIMAVSIIGIITFALSYIGVDFGCRLGQRFGKWSEVLGGIILISLGTKILIEHTLL